jgi:hypothetical protein
VLQSVPCSLHAVIIWKSDALSLITLKCNVVTAICLATLASDASMCGRHEGDAVTCNLLKHDRCPLMSPQRLISSHHLPSIVQALLDRVRLFAHTVALFCCPDMHSQIQTALIMVQQLPRTCQQPRLPAPMLLQQSRVLTAVTRRKLHSLKRQRALSKPKKLLQRAPSTGARR